MVNRMVLGKIIKERRKENKLTQNQLAEKVYLSRSYIADVEQGRYNPSLETFVSIANVLHINLNVLLSKTEIQDKWRKETCYGY